MTKGKEWRHILLFTLPIVAGNLLQQLYNTADGIIVGNFVNEAALASVGTCQPLTFFFLSVSIGLSVGVGVVVAQYFGAGKRDILPAAIDSAMLLLGACGIVMSVIGVLFAPFFLETVLNVPLNISPGAVTYFRIYALGLFFQFVYNGIAAALRGVGNSKATLYFLMIATSLNVVLDLLFVIVFNWGVAGAAIATVIAQIGCAAVSYIYLRRQFKFVRSGAHWNKTIVKTMIKLGLPIAVQQGIVGFGNGSMQRLVNGFGADVPGIIAAFTAGARIDSFIFVPILSFQSGLASFTGQNIGAGRMDRAKRGLHATFVMSLTVTVVMCSALYIFAAPIVTLFGLTESALAIGAEQIRFLAMFFWMFSVYMALGGLLQGAGDTALQSVATLSALAVRITASYAAVGLGLLGYNAAWVTSPMGWGVAMTITFTRYFTGGWKKKSVAGARPPAGIADGK